MMTKAGVLADVQEAARHNLVTLEDVTAAFQAGQPAAATRAVGVVEILYYIGGAVVFTGIAVLLGQHWANLSFATQLLATLGSGCAAYYTGLLLATEDADSRLAQAFFLIAALVLPVGVGLLFDHYGLHLSQTGVQATLTGCLAAFFLTSHWTLRTNVFLVFAIVYTSWFFHSFLQMLIGGTPYSRDYSHMIEFRFLINGIACGLLGYAFAKDSLRRSLSGALYGFGSLMALGGAFCLMEWKPNQNVAWEILNPGLIFGILFLSVYVRSKAFLTFGSIFLIAYIGHITAEYFQHSLGWPLCLVIIGFSLIAVGFGAYRLNLNYLKGKNA